MTDYVVYRQGSMLYRVPKHTSETHEQAFQRAILLSKLDTMNVSAAVKWSIVSAQQLKKQYGLEYTDELESFLTK